MKILVRWQHEVSSSLLLAEFPSSRA